MGQTIDQDLRRDGQADTAVCALPPGPIRTLETLREHLQLAIELEHALIPPYLCALYSLDRAVNPAASSVVASVAVDEMLHMAAVANLLTAVGGRPELDVPPMLPGYPRSLPHTDASFEVSLLPFGAKAIEMFLEVEHPGFAEPARGSRCFDTIGHFYGSIDAALVRLCDERGETGVFIGDPSRQVGDGQGGAIPVVTDLASARAVLATIVEQGEGRSQSDMWVGGHEAAPAIGVAHYYRFVELQVGRRFTSQDTPETGPSGEAILIRPEAIRPVQPNPRLRDQVFGSPIRAAQEDFNQEYCMLLRLLDLTFNGEPELLGEAMGVMHGLREHATALMQMEVPGTSFVAGPTFEYVEPADRW
jgi:hypothetical protein